MTVNCAWALCGQDTGAGLSCLCSELWGVSCHCQVRQEYQLQLAKQSSMTAFFFSFFSSTSDSRYSKHNKVTMVQTTDLKSVIQVPKGSLACWSSYLLLSPIAGKDRDEFSHPLLHYEQCRAAESWRGWMSAENMFMVQKWWVYQEQPPDTFESWLGSRAAFVSSDWIWCHDAGKSLHTAIMYHNGKNIQIQLTLKIQ